MNLQKLSLTQRHPEIIQPNSLQALPARPGECIIPRGNTAFLKDSPLSTTKAPLLCLWHTGLDCTSTQCPCPLSALSPLTQLWSLAQTAASSASSAVPCWGLSYASQTDNTKRNPGCSGCKKLAGIFAPSLPLPSICLWGLTHASWRM